MLKRRKLIIGGVSVLLVAGIAGGIIMGPRLLSAAQRLYTTFTMPVHDQPIPSTGTFANIIFLHHSTGQGLITEGNVRPLLTELGYQFWDHGYNHTGLVDPAGNALGANYRIPGMRGRGDTDVNGLARLFSQPVTEPATNAFSRLLQHEVIIVKSCFPNSAIKDEAMQQQFQDWYVQMRDAMDQHPDRIFIIVTSPPLHPAQTNVEEARRARAVSGWLKSATYLQGHPNVFVFDFFDLLADPVTDMLREAYQRPGEPNSHPNLLANETTGPRFVAFIDETIQAYKSVPQTP